MTINRMVAALAAATFGVGLLGAPATAQDRDQSRGAEVNEMNDPDNTEIIIKDTLRLPGKKPVTTIQRGSLQEMRAAQREQIAAREAGPRAKAARPSTFDTGGSNNSTARGCRDLAITTKQKSAMGLTTLYRFTNRMDYCWTRKNSIVRDVRKSFSYNKDSAVKYNGQVYHRHGFYSPADRPRARRAAHLSRRKLQFEQCIMSIPCQYGEPEISLRGYWNGTYLWARNKG